MDEPPRVEWPQTSSPHGQSFVPSQQKRGWSFAVLMFMGTDEPNTLGNELSITMLTALPGNSRSLSTAPSRRDGPKDQMPKISQNDTQRLLDLLLSGDINGDLVKIKGQSSNKQLFKDLACAYLLEVARQLGLNTFRVDFNPAGPAISGDAILESDKVFVQISGNQTLGVLYRRCVLVGTRQVGKKKAEHRFESARFQNLWFPFSELLNLPKVISRLREISEDP